MSHFDSLAEAPMPRGKIKSEIGPAIGKNRHKDPPTPPAPVLKIQKSDLFCVGNFFASSLFRAALTLIERRPDVRFVRRQKQTFVASLNDGRSGSVVVSDTQR